MDCERERARDADGKTRGKNITDPTLDLRSLLFRLAVAAILFLFLVFFSFFFFFFFFMSSSSDPCKIILHVLRQCRPSGCVRVCVYAVDTGRSLVSMGTKRRALFDVLRNFTWNLAQSLNTYTRGVCCSLDLATFTHVQRSTTVAAFSAAHTSLPPSRAVGGSVTYIQRSLWGGGALSTLKAP